MADICSFIECQTDIVGPWHFCDYHNLCGPIGSGETYEQYEIIERDFIDFIKVVPIDDPNHLAVHSPVLRDIIIRACVQIEIFFKEWSMYSISEDKNHNLWKPYKMANGKKERNWNL